MAQIPQSSEQKHFTAVLEIPECSCFWEIGDDPCAHTLKADHSFSLTGWGDLLADFHPKDYLTPPIPITPTLTTSREARIEEYAYRIEVGCHWQHPEDLGYGELSSIGITTKRARNGALLEGEVISQ